jgi:hypothetical protein
MEQAKYDVFISYSRKDYVDEHKNVIPGNVVSKIKDALKKEGISYWFDEEGIYSGQNFVEKIVTNIEASRIFVFLSTVNANNSKYTCKEIASADEFKKHIIPVRIDSSPYNKKVLFRIADLDYVEYYANPQKGIEDMILSIKAYLEQVKKEEKRKQEEEDYRIKIKREYEERIKEKEKEYQKKLDEEIHRKEMFFKDEIRKAKSFFVEKEESVPNTTKDDDTEKIRKDANTTGGGWAVLALVSPIVTLAFGLYFGIEYKSFWFGTEVFLIPGWVAFSLFLHLSQRNDANANNIFLGAAMFGVSIAAGIHLGQFMDSSLIGVITGVALSLVSLYIAFKDL